MTEHGNAHPILLYDGVCGLCNRMVQFVLKRDGGAVFLFASLQSAFAQRVLRRHQMNPSDLDTFYVVIGWTPETTREGQEAERLLARSEAVLFVLRELGGFWRFASAVSRLIPLALRDWSYNFVTRRRYQFFGRYDACPLPSEATRARFLDI